MKVLIVDDNKMNILIEKKFLEQAGCLVEYVMSGKECLEQIRNKTYDLIFMDIMMPIMDGIETFHQLKKIAGFKTPVIALTADTENDAEEKYLKEGFVKYIAKPLNPKDLPNILNLFS